MVDWDAFLPLDKRCQHMEVISVGRKWCRKDNCSTDSLGGGRWEEVDSKRFSVKRIQYISNVECRGIPSNQLILCIYRDRPKIIAKSIEWVSVLRLKLFLHFKCVIAFPLERCLAHENTLYRYTRLHSWALIQNITAYTSTATANANARMYFVYIRI